MSLLIIAIIFRFAIPSFTFWTLVLIYAAYCLVPINQGLTHGTDSDDSDSEFHQSFVSYIEPNSSQLTDLLGHSEAIKRFVAYRVM